MCGVRDELELLRVRDRLEKSQVKFCAFTEPDRGGELTSLVTGPVYGEQRRAFRRYQCLGVGSECALAG